MSPDTGTIDLSSDAAVDGDGISGDAVAVNAEEVSLDDRACAILDQIEQHDTSNDGVPENLFIQFGITSKEMDKQVNALKEQIEELSATKRALDERKTELQNCCIKLMQKCGVDKVKNAGHSLSIRQSKFVVILNEDSIGMKWIKTEVKTSIDKAGILSMYNRDGTTATGAKVDKRESLVFK